MRELIFDPGRSDLTLIVESVFGGSPKGVEIGVSRGLTSRRLLAKFWNLHLYMVDAWTTYEKDHPYRQSGDGHSKMSRAKQTQQKRDALENTAFAATRRTVLHMTSVYAARLVPDGSLDFAFVDGDHTYEAVLADLRAWSPKVRAGGMICGHDWGHPRDRRGLFGVSQAVREFTFDMVGDLEVHVAATIWAFLKPVGE